MANDSQDPFLPGDGIGRSGRPSAEPDDEIRVVDKRWWAQASDQTPSGAESTRSDKPSYVQELELQLAAKDAELRTTLSRYREANAEFEQARARMRRDVAREVERGKRAILADLLEVLDNLDRALAAARSSSAAGPLLQGVELVRGQFLARLEALGVRLVTALDEAFDPTRHEAATVVPVTDAARDGIVVGVIREGYAIGDDVLRPAVVAVAALTPEGAAS